MKMSFKKQMILIKSDNKKEMEDLKINIRNIFKHHIGKENGISAEEIFMQIFNTNFKDEPFKRYVFWDIINKTMKILRRTGEVFICYQKGNYFVLKTQEESNVYKDILRRDIQAMYGSMKKADEWVLEEKWRNI